MSWEEAIRQQQQQRSAIRKAFIVSAARLTQIQNHPLTKRIRYPQHKDAFDYVHAIYPMANCRQATVYHTPRALLQEVGYGGVGGFYDTTARVICVTDWMGEGEYESFGFGIEGEYTIDEVLCHELIHFCSNYRLPVSNRDIEEEIAYGKSVNYLRLKGRADDFIVKKNMLPYLISLVDVSEVYKKILQAHYPKAQNLSIETVEELIKNHEQEVVILAQKQAIEMGFAIVRAYGDGNNIVKPGPMVGGKNKRLILDDFEE